MLGLCVIEAPVSFVRRQLDGITYVGDLFWASRQWYAGHLVEPPLTARWAVLPGVGSGVTPADAALWVPPLGQHEASVRPDPSCWAFSLSPKEGGPLAG